MKPLRTTIIALTTVLVMLSVRQWAAAPIRIASPSMEPTLKKGHLFVLDRLTFRFRPPLRREIISFRAPAGEDHGSVKRVIAVAGDTVQLKDKKVYLNGEPQYERYAYYARPGELLQGDNLGPITVPEGQLFVLGDNRDNSYDSASWKDPESGAPLHFIPLSAVSGKVRGAY
jgi:signal peptidase I